MAFTSIDNPELYFQCKLYTGNGTDDTSITLDGTENMQPDLVWLKRRDNAGRHRLFDSVRGATKSLRSDDDENEITAADSLKSFDSDGFTLGADSASGGINVNINTETMVAWCWKESATAGFDIVSFTGNGSARTISHSLSAVPRVIMPKARSTDGYEWRIYHASNTSAPETDYLVLNQTYATADGLNVFNDTAPTSSVFSIGDGETPNNSGTTYIAYLFAPKQGYSAMGSYLAEGNADGVYVNLGFRPAFLLIKNQSSASTNWHIYDSKRLGYNVNNDMQRANLTNGDATDDDLDLLSNGFKIRRVTTALNTDGDTYVYMAFAEAPFVNSKGVPTNAK